MKAQVVPHKIILLMEVPLLKEMINFALLGAGRIGKMHANNIVNNPKCNLAFVYDINIESADSVGKFSNSKTANSPEEAINDKSVDAVFIASATSTHTKYIILSAKAGKAILCEKPIDLDINKVNQCYKEIKGLK